MPSRKKDRGKQRKAARQNRDVLACGPPAGIVELVVEGCRVIRHDDGTTRIRHPCFKHIKGNTGAASASAVRKFDRGLLNSEERQELAENYVHNFGQALREGNYDGTNIIMRNMGPHLRQQLGDELVKANIHLSFLHFLSQSDRCLSNVLRREVGADESIKLPSYWVGILLGLLLPDGCSDDTRLTLAKGIEPYVMSMIDDKREVFRSNHVWHVCLPSFFALLSRIMKSKEAFLVMISYEGFLPFVAQASCWSKSREDIKEECRMLRQCHPLESSVCPASFSAVCFEAQRLIALVVAIMHENCDVVEEAELSGALDQIACTPLLSNSPGCNDSTMAGLVRMMNTDIDEQDRELLLGSIIWPLLLEHGYVDAGVIAELIEYGKGKWSVSATNSVLSLMVAILGRDDDYEIEMIDSRYAAATRHGLLEFSIDALVAYGNESDCTIGEDLHFIADGFRFMAMHSKTSRALRKRKAEIMTALDKLRKKCGSQFDEICSLIDVSIDMSAPALCCNCLKEVDRKALFFCKRCGAECYCSAVCQSESYALGHDELCTEEVEFMDILRAEGLSEKELERIAMLKSNLMMNGCRLVRSRAAEFLDDEGNVAKVTVDFEDFPPDAELSRSDEGESSDTLKCTFTSSVFYGFADRANMEAYFLEKVISRRSLAEPGSGAGTVDRRNYLWDISGARDRISE